MSEYIDRQAVMKIINLGWHGYATEKQAQFSEIQIGSRRRVY